MIAIITFVAVSLALFVAVILPSDVDGGETKSKFFCLAVEFIAPVM